MSVDVLKPYAGNARTHSRRQIKKIAASIEHFGFVNPILVDENNQVLAGHGRLAAAKHLGWAEVPTVCIAHLSEADKKAYILADNRLAEDAGWDPEMLAIELQGLIELDFEVELTGFDMVEIDQVLEVDAETKTPEQETDDDIPAPQAVAITRPGDLWQLGLHRLYCGDATLAASYEALLGDDKAAMVFTDPPYNVPIDGHVSGLGKVKHREFAMGCGEMSPAVFQDFLQTVFGHLAAYTQDGSIHFICMDWRHVSETQAAGMAVYGDLKNICVWVKSNGGMGTFYRSRHEFVLAFKKGTAPHINNFGLGDGGRYRTNVWEYAGANSFGRDRDAELAMHPTVKPVALVADAIKDCSKRRQIILDPFGGSGSTLIAAHKTGRRGYLMELDPLYCDTIIRRWQAYSCKHAIHMASGRRFEELEDQDSGTAAAVETLAEPDAVAIDPQAEDN